MSDLNPTPNNKLVVGGVFGLGNAIGGVVAIVFGLVTNLPPLVWVGVALVVFAGVLVAMSLLRKRGRSSSG